MTSYQDIIEQLQLIQHPEGGYYKRLYESDRGACFDGLKPQSLCTAIVYLLHGAEYSSLHRIESDELWFLGQHNTALQVIELTEHGLVETVLDAKHPFHCVKAHTWFAARLADTHEAAFALAYCTVAPGFEFSRFEMAKAQALCAEFPLHAKEISALCRQ